MILSVGIPFKDMKVHITNFSKSTNLRDGLGQGQVVSLDTVPSPDTQTQRSVLRSR